MAEDGPRRLRWASGSACWTSGISTIGQTSEFAVTDLTARTASRPARTRAQKPANRYIGIMFTGALAFDPKHWPTAEELIHTSEVWLM
ncbi:hypothetical protein COCNU_13G000050 [Cocos nucifera]|uniref:Uncharacterized protein n=1 Tax=Cocos nucifera TaxID=13894 RepID=A0A8K0ISB4_COCNU|nr:hypothetical protein COCNU_13G000050 [Cocos nucifera]